MHSSSIWLSVVSMLCAAPALAADVYRGVTLPAQLAGFQRGNVIDNEPTSPGYGLTIAYSTPGIKATVFIYDLGIRGLPEGIENSTVRAQAMQALQDIGSAYPDAKLLEPLSPGPQACANLLRAKVSYANTSQGETELSHSFLYFGSMKNNFIKVRLTYPAKLAFSVGAVSETRFIQTLCTSINR